MQLYELFLTTGGAITGPIVAFTLIAASRPATLLEFGVVATVPSVAGEVYLGIPASKGTGSTGTALQPIDPSDVAASTHVVTGAFATTQPTAPTNPFRRLHIVVSGSGAPEGLIWGWDAGEVIIPTGGQLVLWVASGAATLAGYVKVAEGG